MKSDSFAFRTPNNQEIFVRRWQPDQGELRASVQIAHGMTEHGQRYEPLAALLVQSGCAVYANDHRGHGKTAGEVEKLAYFADANGWDLVVEDMAQLNRVIAEAHPAVPLFFLGHSMGALLVVDYLSRYGQSVAGAVLSSLPSDPGALGNIASLLANIQCWQKGRKSPSPLLNRLTFGKYNRPFAPNRTAFDWLSRDPAEVDQYVSDPFCGTVATAGFFVDLLYGAKRAHAQRVHASIPKALPLFLLSGENDPVTDCARSVIEIEKTLKNNGINDITVKIYPGARHEMLHEINRAEAMADIAAWIGRHLEPT